MSRGDRGGCFGQKGEFESQRLHRARMGPRFFGFQRRIRHRPVRRPGRHSISPADSIDLSMTLEGPRTCANADRLPRCKSHLVELVHECRQQFLRQPGSSQQPAAGRIRSGSDRLGRQPGPASVEVSPHQSGERAVIVLPPAALTVRVGYTSGPSALRTAASGTHSLLIVTGTAKSVRLTVSGG